MSGLTRKQLVEDFEDIVQQEIKNHNDSILQTNMSINEMRDKLKDFESLLSRNSEHIKYVSMSSEASIETARQNFNQSFSSLQSKLNDLRQEQNQKLEDVKKDISKRESYYLTVNSFDTFRVKVDEWISQIKVLFETQKDSFIQELSRSVIANRESCQNLEIKLLSLLEEQSLRFEKINRDLDRMALTFDGLKREIEISKKNLFSVEKNIENLYTQIERLKAGD